MEASALRHQVGIGSLGGRSPLLRLQGDERLVALVRQGNASAFEALVQRYQPRLLAFCRHMLSSKEDAEDVLQEVFAAAYNALLADDRPINVRPWLYRIARNRSLNHLRKPKPTGVDSMDIFERENGATTAETVHRREEFRQIVSDVQDLPETQKTALLLREIDALSYEHIAEAMDATVPSVKSLLVRARVSLAEAAEARLLTCEEVRFELGQVAEGIAKSSPPVRRHLKSCERCRVFRAELRNTTKALAAVFPLGPLVILKKIGLAKLGLGGGGAAAGGSAGAGGAGLAGGAGIAAGGAFPAAAGGALSAGLGTVASKAAAGMAAAMIVTAGAVEVEQVARRDAAPARVVASAPPKAPTIIRSPAAPVAKAKPEAAVATGKDATLVKPAAQPPVTPATEPVAPAAEPTPVPLPEPTPVPVPAPVEPPVQEDESSTTLPPREVDPEAAPADPIDVPSGKPSPGVTPAPPAGEPTSSQPPPPPPPSN